jgi:hypothetical protein
MTQRSRLCLAASTALAPGTTTGVAEVWVVTGEGSGGELAIGEGRGGTQIRVMGVSGRLWH